MGHASFTMFGVLTALACFTVQTAMAKITSTEVFYENASGSPLIPLLNIAKKTIDIEIYTMNDPLVRASIIQAMTRGVKVRIIQESQPVATSCKVFEAAVATDVESCRSSKEFLNNVRILGGTYVPFARAELCGVIGSRCYQHGKIVLVDDQYSMLSTGNFDSSSFCNRAGTLRACNRDYSMVSVDLTVIRTLKKIFEKDLTGKAYDLQSVVASSGTSKLTVSPYSLSPLINLIRSAKKTIQIQNQYLKDPQFNEALVEAAKRGVQVFVNISSACSFGKPSPNDAAKLTQIYSTFDSVKINTRMFTSKMMINGVNGYLHAKTILVDGTRAWVGSVNGSTTSFSNNREYGLFFSDAAQVRKLAAFLYSDYMNPNGETWQESLVCKNDFPISNDDGQPAIN